MILNRTAFFVPDSSVVEETITISRPIVAIQLVQKEDGEAKLGLLAQLGPGTTVQRCGHGFNDRTTKVRANGQCYFVFAQDLELQGSRAATPFE